MYVVLLVKTVATSTYQHITIAIDKHMNMQRGD